MKPLQSPDFGTRKSPGLIVWTNNSKSRLQILDTKMDYSRLPDPDYREGGYGFNEPTYDDVNAAASPSWRRGQKVYTHLRVIWWGPATRGVQFTGGEVPRYVNFLVSSLQDSDDLAPIPRRTPGLIAIWSDQTHLEHQKEKKECEEERKKGVLLESHRVRPGLSRRGGRWSLSVCRFMNR